jgi:hypothetical protein
VYINQCLFLNAFVDEEKRREEFYNSRGFSKLKKGMFFFSITGGNLRISFSTCTLVILLIR